MAYTMNIMMIVNDISDDRKWRQYDKCVIALARVVIYAYRVISYAPTVVNYPPRVILQIEASHIVVI